MKRLFTFGLLLSFILVMLSDLTGCGRKSSPQPVGPAYKITYPRTYPPD